MVRKDERQRSSIDYRIRFFTHKGKEILLVDLSNCTPAEVEQISRKVPDYVTTKPPKSVLLLADFAGASFDQNAVWITERERSTWFKILNREYSQKDGREELFERERHSEPVAGWHSCVLACEALSE